MLLKDVTETAIGGAMMVNASVYMKTDAANDNSANSSSDSSNENSGGEEARIIGVQMMMRL